ncbi:aldose 1-epimerase [Alteraurantiacibacter aestuarii]|uniref:Aldose 1-epimerase n=1 Tax=Alteraurantiacibacter aestuarii TaxID=650004 RepID=A0A844ZM78_9SPHN|nr:aldose 1-epimerase [Alteraurantiacibacter aestuarii]MXO88206.1 aldose 1-epimerase [Alteraurantiacibacter aestuarii]
MPGLTLRAGDWQAGVLPAVGGALSHLSFRGVDILRTMPPQSGDVLQAACFPLVPYCNRIRDAAFEWQEQAVQLPHNFMPETSSLHGLGWQEEWQVTGGRDFKIAMVHNHAGSGPARWNGQSDQWPWAYEAEQRIRLGPKGCAISLTLTNRSNIPMPAGLGLHPYFRRRAGSRVQFHADGMLMVDDALIPTGEIAPPALYGDWENGSALPASTIDHCFSGWNGSAVITDDLGTITLAARGAPFLHLYAPADGSALCLEPVSHAPDALNQDPGGITALPPACSATLQLWIGADA